MISLPACTLSAGRMSIKQINEALNELPAQIDAALNERKAARPSRVRAAAPKPTYNQEFAR